MDFKNRFARLSMQVSQAKLDAFLVTHPTDIYYLTGLQLSAGKILIKGVNAVLLVDGRYFELCQKQSPIPCKLYDEKIFWDFLNDVKTIGIDGENTQHQAFIDFEKECQDHACAVISTRGILTALRAIKDPLEIKRLKKAADLGSLGFDYLLDNLKEGVSEEELALGLEIFWRQKGAMGLSFEPIIAFGTNSSMPHYRAGKALLKKGQIVLFDIGVNLDHYHSDMTRVVFFGEVDNELKKIRAIVEQAYLAALNLCHPGTLISDLDEAARSVIRNEGYGDKFTHSLGHGVGLDVHEFPTLRRHPKQPDLKLEEGMAITIEPGIYLPNLGGVRIEDTVVIQKDGYQNLTNRKTYNEVMQVV